MSANTRRLGRTLVLIAACAGVLALAPAGLVRGSEIITITKTTQMYLYVDETTSPRSGYWTVEVPFNKYMGRFIRGEYELSFSTTAGASWDGMTLGPGYMAQIRMEDSYSGGHETRGSILYSLMVHDDGTIDEQISDVGYKIENYWTSDADRPTLILPHFKLTRSATIYPHFSPPPPRWWGLFTGTMRLSITYDASDPTPIPEPTTWVSAAVGAAVVLARAWRSRSRRRRVGAGPGRAGG